MILEQFQVPKMEDLERTLYLATRVSMEVGKQLVCWFITHLGDLQPTYIRVII